MDNLGLRSHFIIIDSSIKLSQGSHHPSAVIDPSGQ